MMLGSVYKLTPHNCSEFYIGSTINMTERKKRHKKDVKKSQAKLYKKIRENGGDFEMEVLYECECETEQELHMEERRCYDKLKPTLNTLRPYVSDDEFKQEQREAKKSYYQANKEKISQYRLENKDAIKKQKAVWYENTKDERREDDLIRSRKYYEANKEQLKEKNMVYREANKEKIKERGRKYYEANREKLKIKQQEIRDAKRIANNN